MCYLPLDAKYINMSYLPLDAKYIKMSYLPLDAKYIKMSYLPLDAKCIKMIGKLSSKVQSLLQDILMLSLFKYSLCYVYVLVIGLKHLQ